MSAPSSPQRRPSMNITRVLAPEPTCWPATASTRLTSQIRHASFCSMVPGVYDTYLAAMATAAAALIGLLFVAVSVRDDTIFGPNAVPGGEALAITAFTGLVNSFVVSLLGLIPKTNIGEPAVIMAVIGIIAIVRLQRRLHTARNLLVLAITLLAYAAQLGFGVLLLVDPHDSGQLINLSFIVFVTLIVSLQRAWSLLKGKHLASAGGTAVAGDHDPPHRPRPGRDWLHPRPQKRRGESPR
jgi:hypothetical protein